MKSNPRLKTVLLAAVLSGVASISLLAQDASPSPSASPGPRPPSDQGRPPHHHPPNPLMEALDTNHDGILSADEIANAPASLKKLDKNGDGQLTEDELRPPPPPGGPNGGPPHGHRGPGDSSSVTPDQQAPDKDVRQQPAVAQQGAAVTQPSPEDGSESRQVPVAARAQRQPPHLSDDPVVARLEQAALKVD